MYAWGEFYLVKFFIWSKTQAFKLKKLYSIEDINYRVQVAEVFCPKALNFKFIF